MAFTDDNVSPTMNGFLIIANIINIIYNVPQILKTYKSKSTKDFSGWFISLRIVGNTIWLAYAFEINSMQMIINNIVTVLASLFIGYYKYLELREEYRGRKILNYQKLSEPIVEADEHDEDVILDFRREYTPGLIKEDVENNTVIVSDEDMIDNNQTIYNSIPYIKI